MAVSQVLMGVQQTAGPSMATSRQWKMPVWLWAGPAAACANSPPWPACKACWHGWPGRSPLSGSHGHGNAVVKGRGSRPVAGQAGGLPGSRSSVRRPPPWAGPERPPIIRRAFASTASVPGISTSQAGASSVLETLARLLNATLEEATPAGWAGVWTRIHKRPYRALQRHTPII